MRICPFCKNEYRFVSKHIYTCKSAPKELNKEERRYQGIEFFVGKDNIEKIIENYNNLMSLPEIKNKYGLDYKNIIWLLQYKGIKTRSLSESQHLISSPKSKKTLQKKYGDNITSVSQLDYIKEKKKQTFLKHYGYDNIWKTPEYAQFTSDRWKNMDPKQKKELINKCIKNRKNNGFSSYSISKLENKIVNVLNDLNIPLQTQFKFKNHYYRYDILLSNTNIIIEINGDYWHANPKKYNENDILNFPGNKKIKAKDIWEKDRIKNDYAKNKGYNIIILWEDEINKSNDLKLLVMDSIISYIN